MVKYFDVEIKKFEEMELISLRSNPYTLETNFRFRIGIEIYVDSIVKITFAFREFRLILKSFDVQNHKYAIVNKRKLLKIEINFV